MAPGDGFAFWGYPEFTLGLRSLRLGRAEVKLSFRGAGFVWGGPYPLPGATVDAAELLGGLARAWPVIGAPFHVEDSPRDDRHADDKRADDGRPDGEPADDGPVPHTASHPTARSAPRIASAPAATTEAIAHLAPGDGIAAVSFHVRGRAIAVTANGRSHDFGGESLFVAEIVLAFADAVARGLGDHPAVAAWREARARADLLPWRAEMAVPPEADPDGAQELASAFEEAVFYCRKLGIDPALYLRASAFLAREQARFALGQRQDEPRWVMPRGQGAARLPTLDELKASIDADVMAAAVPGRRATWNRFLAEAVLMRLMDLRHAVYFAPAEP